MKQSEITYLLTLYGQRYGKWNMEKETMGMWSHKLKDQDAAQVKAVFQDLLGEKEKPWGWGKIFEMLDARYPADNNQFELERQWRSDPKTPSLKEKQKELGAFMRDLIVDIKYRKKKKLDQIDWLSAYAHKFIEVMGRGEARDVMQKIQGGESKTEHEMQFLALVSKELA